MRVPHYWDALQLAQGSLLVVMYGLLLVCPPIATLPKRKHWQAHWLQSRTQKIQHYHKQTLKLSKKFQNIIS